MKKEARRERDRIESIGKVMITGRTYEERERAFHRYGAALKEWALQYPEAALEEARKHPAQGREPVEFDGG